MRHIYSSSPCFNWLLAGLFSVLSVSSADAQIKIGTNGAIIAPASILELESANQGLLLPRLADTVAINALTPPNGMLIYLTKQPSVGLYVRKVTGWEYLTGSLAGNARFNSLTVAGDVTAGTFRGPLLGNATTATTVSGNVAAVNGGTGQSLYNPGDLLYASTSIALSKLPIGLPGRVLGVTAGGMPAWLNAGSGTVGNVSGTANRVIVSDPTVSPVIDISPNYAGQTSITTLGTISTGVWNGSAVPTANGGTGLTSLPAGILIGNGTGPVTTTTGAAGLVLTSTGIATPPTFQVAAAGDMLLNVVQTVTANKTFNDGTLILKGSGTGLTTLKSNASSVGTVTLPPANSVLASLDGAETLTFKTLDAPTLTGTTNFASASGSTLTVTGNITAGTFLGPLTGNVNGTATFVTNVDNLTAIFVADMAELTNTATSTNTAGSIVRRDGSGAFTVGPGSINGNITGTASNVTSTVAIANGGTGATTKATGFNALSPMTTSGDMIYGGAAGSGLRLPIGVVNTFVKSDGVSPVWGSVDLSATDVTGILTSAKGGTGVNNGVNTISLGGNLVTRAPLTVINGSFDINFGTIVKGTIQDVSFTVTDAADGDPVSLGVPDAVMQSAQGAIFTAWVSATDVVSIRFTNASNGDLNPIQGTFKVKVLK